METPATTPTMMVATVNRDDALIPYMGIFAPPASMAAIRNMADPMKEPV